jgi:hypothetical protein
MMGEGKGGIATTGLKKSLIFAELDKTKKIDSCGGKMQGVV